MELDEKSLEWIKLIEKEIEINEEDEEENKKYKILRKNLTLIEEFLENYFKKLNSEVIIKNSYYNNKKIIVKFNENIRFIFCTNDKIIDITEEYVKNSKKWVLEFDYNNSTYVSKKYNLDDITNYFLKNEEKFYREDLKEPDENLEEYVEIKTLKYDKNSTNTSSDIPLKIKNIYIIKNKKNISGYYCVRICKYKKTYTKIFPYTSEGLNDAIYFKNECLKEIEKYKGKK